MTKQKYKVFIDDNFHFMDESQRYSSGIFDTHDEAVNKCKEIIYDFLESAVSSTDTQESLYNCWLMYGEDPFIVGVSLSEKFSSTDYTRRYCQELIANLRHL